jgi:hypothetical protein
MSETEQLKPCPFCGVDARIIDHEDAPIDAYKWEALHYCDDESVIAFKADTKQEAICKWNARAISLDEKEQMGKLKSFVNDLIDEAISHGSFTQDELLTKVIAYSLASEVPSAEINHNIDRVIKADWLKD